MDYSREKISSTTAPVAVYLLFRFPPFPLTIIHIGIRRLLQLVTGFVGRSATRRLLFLVHSCLSNTSLAAGQCAREAAGHPTSYLKWYLI